MDEFTIEVTQCSEHGEGQALIHGRLRGDRLLHRKERVQLQRTGAITAIDDVASLGAILRRQGAHTVDGTEGSVALTVSG